MLSAFPLASGKSAGFGGWGLAGQGRFLRRVCKHGLSRLSRRRPSARYSTVSLESIVETKIQTNHTNGRNRDGVRSAGLMTTLISDQCTTEVVYHNILVMMSRGQMQEREVHEVFFLQGLAWLVGLEGAGLMMREGETRQRFALCWALIMYTIVLCSMSLDTLSRAWFRWCDIVISFYVMVVRCTVRSPRCRVRVGVVIMMSMD